MSDEKVKEFVRSTLGCDCAEEVFSHIENEKNVGAGGTALKNKINVGNRLLVYIVEANSDTIAKLPALIMAGKSERDEKGFNRFRLVLASDDKDFRRRGFEAFKALGIADPKIHLHIIGKKETTGL